MSIFSIEIFGLKNVGPIYFSVLKISGKFQKVCPFFCPKFTYPNVFGPFLEFSRSPLPRGFRLASEAREDLRVCEGLNEASPVH